MPSALNHVGEGDNCHQWSVSLRERSGILYEGVHLALRIVAGITIPFLDSADELLNVAIHDPEVVVTQTAPFCLDVTFDSAIYLSAHLRS
jgi:hypothetical protein